MNLSINFLISATEAAEIENSDILWDRIVSIEYIGYEHVYDIEVGGTHNFIGNGIFAHNTAISGSGLDGGGSRSKESFDTRYYLQNPIEGEYKGSANELLTDKIRRQMAVGLLDNLGDSAESFRLREAFIKLIKEDGEITGDELEILVKHIENVMKAIDHLTGITSDEEKREAIIRVALYLSIEEIQRVKELEKMPKGNIRRYYYQRIEVARRLGVGPQEIELINPSSTDVAVVINKYFRDKKERQEVAGKVVDIVTKYLLGELEVEKKTENCIKRIIRGKDIKIIDVSSSGVPSMRDRYDTAVIIDQSA